MPLALSISGGIDKIGAYAGFAALFAIALLSLLYFAQARELKRLSQWIAREPERMRAAAAAAPVVVAQPRPVAAPPVSPQGAPATAVVAARPTSGAIVATTVPGVRRVRAPGAPASTVPPPATQAATPPAADPATVAPPASAGDTAPPAVVGSDTDPAGQSLPTMPAPPEASADQPTSGGEPPSTTAEPKPAAVPLAAAPVAERTADVELDEEHAEPLAPMLPPAPHKDSPVIAVPLAAPVQEPVRVRRGRRPAGTVADEALVPPPPRRGRKLRGRGGNDGRAGAGGNLSSAQAGRRRLLLVGAVLALVVVAGAVVVLAGGGGTKHTPPANTASVQNTTTTSTTSSGKTTKTKVLPAPSTITVAVLNGTTTAQLASKVSNQLVGDGYQRGAVANAPNQSTATTTVGYTPGHQAAAVEVARSLALGESSATPVTSADDAAASNAGAAAQVVVTLGANYTQ